MGDSDGSRVSPDGSGDSWLGSALSVGWTACAGGCGCTGAGPSGDGDGLDSRAWVTDWTVVTHTAGFGLRASAVAPSNNRATAHATASASFLPVIGR